MSETQNQADSIRTEKGGGSNVWKNNSDCSLVCVCVGGALSIVNGSSFFCRIYNERSSNVTGKFSLAITKILPIGVDRT